jgi:general secretion pathway protein H
MGSRSRGYTLIEILTVLVIIGIVLALARVQYARSPAQTLEDEARRLALVLEFARDEAMTRGCTLAWTARSEAHRLECRRGQTAAAADEAHYAKRPWTGSVALERVSIAGVTVPRESPLLFTPSGINAPFELVLAMDGNRVHVAGDFLGRVSVAAAASRADVQR